MTISKDIKNKIIVAKKYLIKLQTYLSISSKSTIAIFMINLDVFNPLLA